MMPEFLLGATCFLVSGSGTIRFSGGAHVLWPVVLAMETSLLVSSGSSVTFTTQILFQKFSETNSTVSFAGGSGVVDVNTFALSPGSSLSFKVQTTTSMTLTMRSNSPIDVTGVRVDVSLSQSATSVSIKLIGFTAPLIGSFVIGNLPQSGTRILGCCCLFDC